MALREKRPAGRAAPRNGDRESKRRRERERDPEQCPLFEHELKEGLICPYRMWNELPASGVQGKLLSLPISTRDFTTSRDVPSLEVEARVPFVSEHEHGLIIDLLHPGAYDVPDAGTDGFRLDLPGRGKAAPKAGGFLQNAQHMPNDVHTLMEQFYTGHDAAEKRLRRNPIKVATVDEAIARIEKTFEDVAGAPSRLPHMAAEVTPVATSPIFPDHDQFATDLVTVVFDENPLKPGLDAPLWLVQHMPHGTPGGSDMLGEPARNLFAKDVFTAYVSTDPGITLERGADTLEAGEALDMTKGTCYVFDNRMANEQKKLMVQNSKDVTHLLLVRPAKLAGGRGDEPTLYTLQKQPIENMRKHSTFGLGRLAAPEHATVTARAPSDAERVHTDEVRELLAGNAPSADDVQQAALLDAYAAAKLLE